MSSKFDNVTTTELRKFGLVVGGVFFLIGAVSLYLEKSSYIVTLGLGTFLIVFGVAAPKLLSKIYKYWMLFAEKLSVVSTTIILGLTFICVIVPIALLIKILGKDLLSRKIDKSANSYWVTVKHDRASERFTTPY